MSFGSPPANLVEIANEIISAARKPEVADSCPAWTRAIKTALRESGRRRGYAVSTALRDVEPLCYEWLLDLIWWNPKKHTILLGLESEWGDPEEVLYDFSKLLCTKAPLKVMVYFAYKEPFLERFQEYLTDFDHHVKDEQYLFVEFHPNRSDQAYFCIAKNDGAVGDTKILPLDRGESAAA